MQTRRNRSSMNKTRKTANLSIQHHHFLLRMELKHVPGPRDKKRAMHLLKQIICDLNMKFLAKPRIFYVEHPHYNQGLTAIAPIKTSHIAFHFWNNPEHSILHNPESRGLLEFDIYTCGALTIKHIQRVLHHLTHYCPTHINASLLNRNYALKLEKQFIWDASKNESWATWLNKLK